MAIGNVLILDEMLLTKNFCVPADAGTITIEMGLALTGVIKWQ